MSQGIPWEKEKFSVLLDAAKTAIVRTRYVFAAINISAIVMISAEFNLYFPWVRYVGPRHPERQGPVFDQIVWRDLRVRFDSGQTQRAQVLIAISGQVRPNTFAAL